MYMHQTHETLNYYGQKKKKIDAKICMIILQNAYIARQFSK
jgi:hypothetical protein